MIGSLLKISLILPYINELFFRTFRRNDSLILYGVRQVQTPEILLKKTTFISVGFQIDEQIIIDYWSKNLVSRFNKNPNFNYLEFPIVSPKQAPNKYIQQFIDNQMRASIPVSIHSNVVTIYEDYSLVLSKFGKYNYDGPYFFITNSSGETLAFANDSDKRNLDIEQFGLIINEDLSNYR